MSPAEGGAKEGTILNPRLWEGPVALVASCLGALFIQSRTQLRGLALPVPDIRQSVCRGHGAGLKANLDHFLGKVDWQSMIILEGVAAFFVVALVALVLKQVWNGKTPAYKKTMAALMAIGACLILADIISIWSIWHPDAYSGFVTRLQALFPSHPGAFSFLKHDGLLSRLLDAVAGTGSPVRDEVVWGRMMGEPAGLAIGVGLFAAITLPMSTTPEELAGRSRHLGHLLYAASVLFVIGLLMTRANFSWILAQWDWSNPDFPPESRKEIVESGVKLAGAGYSAILAVFYLPARWILQGHIDKTVPEGKQTRGTQAREAWLKENGFAAGWRDDIKQILAVLAPVLAAPIFETLAK
jgi:hypothetical protein